MKLPRDLSGLELAKALAMVGYTVTRHLKVEKDALVEKLFG